MKVCLIQPAYCTDYSKSDEYFAAELAHLDKCDESMDLIVLPESADIPCLAPDRESAEASVRKYKDRLINKCRETAKRCNSLLFVNARYEMEDGSLRNTTYAIDRNGEIAGLYFKEHLVPSEVSVMNLDSDYTFEHTEPTVIEIEGLRFGFLVCYDFYFYENFANMARYNLDFVIGCSHQRSDRHSALEIMCRQLAYNTNAYVVRASISMDESSDICGASMVVAPDGEVLVNMKSRVGLETVEIDPKKKYLKPAGYGNPDAAHYEYIETGRRPWKYRPAGSAISKHDNLMPYPRICAHRGFSSILPENSMAAFGAAIAMGADEIEFDLWYTKDGEIVSIHDPTLDRVSNGSGKVYEKTCSELLELDFGIKYGDKFAGMKIPTFEDILKKFSCHAVMNIHIKTPSDEYPEEAIKKILALIRKYDCEKYVYFMISNDSVIKQFKKAAPNIPICVGAGDAPWKIVDRAISLGAEKVQLYKPYFNREMVDKAHENGIRCNVFFADSEDEAREYLDMGIDTILTNEYNRISQILKK